MRYIFHHLLAAEPGEKIASPSLVEQAAKAAESVADELARAEGREVTLYEDPAPPLQLLLPDDGFSCDVVQGVPPGKRILITPQIPELVTFLQEF